MRSLVPVLKFLNTACMPRTSVSLRSVSSLRPVLLRRLVYGMSPSAPRAFADDRNRRNQKFGHHFFVVRRIQIAERIGRIDDELADLSHHPHLMSFRLRAS